MVALQEPTEPEMPKWCGPAKAAGAEVKEAPPTAGPKSWQGIGEYQASLSPLFGRVPCS